LSGRAPLIIQLPLFTGFSGRGLTLELWEIYALLSNFPNVRIGLTFLYSSH